MKLPRHVAPRSGRLGRCVIYQKSMPEDERTYLIPPAMAATRVVVVGEMMLGV